MSFLAVLLLFFAPGASDGPADLLVVIDGTRTIRTFDPNSGARVAEARLEEGLHEVEILADGKTVAVSDYGRPETPGRTLTLLNLDRLTSLGRIHLGDGTKPYGLAALRDGRLVVVAQGTKELLIVDPKQRRVVTRIPTALAASRMVAVTPDGARAFIVSNRVSSGLVTAVDLAPPRIVRDIVIAAGAEGIDVTPDGQEVWITSRDAGSVSVLEARNLGIVARILLPRSPTRVKITPDGKRALVLCEESGDVAVFDSPRAGRSSGFRSREKP